MDRIFSDGGPVPRPPRLRQTWTTWAWLTFAVAVVILTIVGLYYTGAAYFH